MMSNNTNTNILENMLLILKAFRNHYNKTLAIDPFII